MNLPRVSQCLGGLATALGLCAPVAALDWPHGKQAAVSLGYDDGLPSQLDHVLPALNRRSLKASFYLPINSPTLPGRLAEWRAAAAAGHELGNHSLFHACSASPPGRDWVLPHHDLDHQRPAEVQEQVIAANTWLQALDGKTRRTFTPPCFDTRAGGEDFVAALHANFVAMRNGAGEIADPLALDPYAVPVVVIEGWTADRLIALVERAAAAHSMAVLLFHGVGADYLSVSREAHDALLDHLARHRDRFWTASFVDVMTHVRQQQAVRR